MIEKKYVLNLNFWCILLHFISFVVMLTEVNNDKSKFPLYRTYIDANDSGDVSQWVLKVESTGYTINIFILSAMFFGITSVFHMIYYIHENINEQIDDTLPIVEWTSSQVRFAEYCITAPIMIMIISLLFGVFEVFLLVSITIICHSVMLFGFIQNDHTSTLGWSPYVAMWGVLIAYFVRNGEKNDIPDFVYAVLVVEIILFSMFGMVKTYYNGLCSKGGYQSLQHSQTNEIWWYNILSLTSKLCLGYIAFFGIKNMG